jgi:hypothetical protein
LGLKLASYAQPLPMVYLKRGELPGLLRRFS